MPLHFPTLLTRDSALLWLSGDELPDSSLEWRQMLAMLRSEGLVAEGTSELTAEGRRAAEAVQAARSSP